MARIDFDAPVDRLGGPFPDSRKWNRYRGRDVLPLWLADMDFPAPAEVQAALLERVRAGVFGYAEPWPSLVARTVAWLESQYAWKVDPAWLVWVPGVVSGLNVACRSAGGGRPVLAATPAYPHFLGAPAAAGRGLVAHPLARAAGGAWGWDFATLRAQVARERPGLFLLCHPHNPTGRAWADDELAELLACAEEAGMVVCSDEIFADLQLSGRRHRPFASLSAEAAARTITLMSPSKTFNLPGLACAFAVIPDTALRAAFERAMHGIVPRVNALGLAACEAAFGDTGAWLPELRRHLAANAARVQAFVASQPRLSMAPPEATFLAWIDARGLGSEGPHALLERHGLGLSDGAEFGAPGFVRLNFGCARPLLEEALARLGRACAGGA